MHFEGTTAAGESRKEMAEHAAIVYVQTECLGVGSDTSHMSPSCFFASHLRPIADNICFLVVPGWLFRLKVCLRTARGEPGRRENCIDFPAKHGVGDAGITGVVVILSPPYIVFVHVCV